MGFVIDDLESRIAELEAENGRLSHLLRTLKRTPSDIQMESGVNDRGKPFVRLLWGDESAQMSPPEAKLHALKLLEVANRAESDAAIFAAIAASGGSLQDIARVIDGWISSDEYTDE